MADETKQKGAPDPELDLGWDLDDDDGPTEWKSQRPTLAPPFDLASYAKEAMVPQSGGPIPPPAAGKPSRPPPRAGSLPPPPPLPNRPLLGRRPSAFPPRSAPSPNTPKAPSGPPAAAAQAIPTPSPPPAQAMTPAVGMPAVNPERPLSEPPSQRITPREMMALEAARTLTRTAESTPAEPPPPSRGNTLLALANHRAPLLTPPRVPAVTLPSSTTPEAAAKAGGANVRVVHADPVVEMQERFALGDYSGALVMAESMLEENPTHPEAREYAESCRSVLQQMYTARIGPLHRVPVVDVARDQLRWLSIDHRAGFILSLVDGVSSLEMILDVCGMPPLDALRTLYELVQQHVVSIQDD